MEEIQLAEGATLKLTPTTLLQAMKRMDLDPNIYPRHKSPTLPATKETDLLKRVEQAHYTAASKQPAIFSSIAAIPKDGGTLVRLIHDGSHPEGRKRYE